MSGCIFCAIAAGEAERSVVYQEATVLAVMDIQPINAGHVVVMPRRHAASIGDLVEAEGARLFEIARRCAQALYASGIRCDGVNLFLADGEVAGQEVFHTHLHVLPRFRGDGFGVRIDSEHTVRPRRELDDTAARIREAWS